MTFFLLLAVSVPGSGKPLWVNCNFAPFVGHPPYGEVNPRPPWVNKGNRPGLAVSHYRQSSLLPRLNFKCIKIVAKLLLSGEFETSFPSLCHWYGSDKVLQQFSTGLDVSSINKRVESSFLCFRHKMFQGRWHDIVQGGSLH